MIALKLFLNGFSLHTREKKVRKKAVQFVLLVVEWLLHNCSRRDHFYRSITYTFFYVLRLVDWFTYKYFSSNSEIRTSFVILLEGCVTLFFCFVPFQIMEILALLKLFWSSKLRKSAIVAFYYNSIAVYRIDNGQNNKVTKQIVKLSLFQF